MTLKTLKQKVSNNLPEILGVTVTVAVATAAVIVVKKNLTGVRIGTAIRDAITTNGGNIDMSSVEAVNSLHDLIDGATEAGVSFVSKDEAIIFLSR